MTAPLLPDQCLAAVFEGVGHPLRLTSFPVAAPQEFEAVVRIECCTICGSDLHTATGARREKTPSILGHEICGEIIALGTPAPQDLGKEHLQIGDRVTWSTAVSCGACDRCGQGLPQKCRQLAKFGHESTSGPWPLSGGLSEIVILPKGTAIIRIPKSVPSEVICPVNCATATVAAALRTAGGVNGKRILIFGAGMLGLTAAALAHHLGATAIVICDRDRGRLELSKRFGATAQIEWHEESDALRRRCLDQSGHSSFDVILELSGAAPAVESAVQLGDIGAKVILVGTVMPSRPIQIDPESLVRRWISIHGVHNYAPQDLRTAVEFLVNTQQKYPFADLVPKTFALAEADQAIHFAVENRPIRIAVIPNSRVPVR